MKYFFILPIVAVVLAVRIAMFRRRRRGRTSQDTAYASSNRDSPVRSVASPPSPSSRHDWSWPGLDRLGDVGLIATREIRERVRGRIFRIGTLVVLLAVAAAIIIPKLHSGSSVTIQTVGVVGGASADVKDVVDLAGRQNQDSVKFVPEPTLAGAKADLRSGKIDLAVVNDGAVLLNQPAASKSSPADPSLVEDVAKYLGVLKAYQAAGLTPTQASLVAHAKSVPIRTLQSGSKSRTNTTSVFGIVVLFLLLTQYLTWTLIGVMQEKSSRVVEVLLATVRPIQLLGGKVLGIGLVAIGQATLIVGFALALSAAVGSDLLHGTEPLSLLAELLWFLLGYAFYCWVYAAAGSTAERQDQVQTLALPLSIPILLGYILSITVVSTGNPDLFFKVLAYLPPTAPFCMSVLVGLSDVTWWQFVASAMISIAGTVAMASFAARIYRRAVLRTGGRVRVRDLLARTAP